MHLFKGINTMPWIYVFLMGLSTFFSVSSNTALKLAGLTVSPYNIYTKRIACNITKQHDMQITLIYIRSCSDV